MTTNARQFLNEIADTLRASGRTVTIEETTESFGTFAWLYAPAPNWYDRSISLSARFSDNTGRWAIGELKVGPTSVSGGFIETTRHRIRTAVSVYAH